MKASREVISLTDIRKTYVLGKQVVHALDGVTLAFQKGDYMALMGSSGSGKSTLMNIIGCLDNPTSGEYLLDGVTVSSLSTDELAEIRNEKIGFVFQTFHLMPRYSCVDNVALPLIYAGVSTAERKERAIESLKSVGLGDRLDHKPNELSGGQRQRVAIARALVNKPSILLADEPTGNLDSKTSLEVMDLFGALHAEGQTIIMVTHEDDIATYAKQTVELKDGRLI